MKRSVVVVLAVLLFGLLVFPVASYAWHGRGGVFIGVGPVWWGAPYPYWGYPPPYYYPPAPIVIEQPPVYVQQPQTPPAPPSAPPSYWYYCSSAQAYYPQAQSCPEAWIKVPPRAQ